MTKSTSDRILKYLAMGPATTDTIASGLKLPSNVVSASIARSVGRGDIVRICGSTMPPTWARRDRCDGRKLVQAWPFPMAHLPTGKARVVREHA